MTISIIIVNYNAREMLSECLDSIKKYSTGVEYEIIVFDNNSSDGIEDVIKNHMDVRFILNKENIGFARANNEAMKLACGEYCLLLNNDTLFIENSLQNILDYYTKLTIPALVGCKLLNKDRSIQLSFGMFPTLVNVIGANLFLYKVFPNIKWLNKHYLNRRKIANPVEVGYVIGAFIFAKTSYFRQLNGFDVSFFFYGEELDLCKRFADVGGHVIYYPNTSVIHFGGATTENMPLFKYKNQHFAIIQLYKKHFTRSEYFLAVFFHYIGSIIRSPLFIIGGVILRNKQLILRGFYTFRILWTFRGNRLASKSGS